MEVAKILQKLSNLETYPLYVIFSKQNSLIVKKNKTNCAPSSLYTLVLLCNSNEYLYKQYFVKQLSDRMMQQKISNN